MTRDIGAGLLAVGLIVGACEDRDSSPPTMPPPVTAPTERPKTPIDQSNASGDVAIVAGIRKAIVDDSSMSMNAQNCKIIVESGVVTLRGLVDSQAEKDAIEVKARAVSGVTRVDNQLEVKSR